MLRLLLFKFSFCFFLIILSSPHILSQESSCDFHTTDDSLKICVTPDKEADPQIAVSLSEYILKIIKEIKIDTQIEDYSQTKTIVRITISSEGKIIKKETLRKGIDGIAEEMFEMFEKISWSPAECNGEKVNSQLTLPLQICLR